MGIVTRRTFDPSGTIYPQYLRRQFFDLQSQAAAPAGGPPVDSQGHVTGSGPGYAAANQGENRFLANGKILLSANDPDAARLAARNPNMYQMPEPPAPVPAPYEGGATAGTGGQAGAGNWTPSTEQTSYIQQQIAAAAKANAAQPVKKFARGGTINEPIFGVGQSGQTYQFGERGRQEQVTPSDRPQTVAPRAGKFAKRFRNSTSKGMPWRQWLQENYGIDAGGNSGGNGQLGPTLPIGEGGISDGPVVGDSTISNSENVANTDPGKIDLASLVDAVVQAKSQGADETDISNIVNAAIGGGGSETGNTTPTGGDTIDPGTPTGGDTIDPGTVDSGFTGTDQTQRQGEWSTAAAAPTAPPPTNPNVGTPLQTTESGTVMSYQQPGQYMPGSEPSGTPVQTAESGTVYSQPEQGQYLPPGNEPATSNYVPTSSWSGDDTGQTVSPPPAVTPAGAISWAPGYGPSGATTPYNSATQTFAPPAPPAPAYDPYHAYIDPGITSGSTLSPDELAALTTPTIASGRPQ